MKTKEPRTTISQMLGETSEDSSFRELFEERLRARRILKDLTVRRAIHHMSQKDIADRIGCTQSRVSKLESTNDADLRLGDLARYAAALGLRVNIVLESNESTPVARVKSLAFQIRHELERLASFAAKDHQIARGVSGFFGEAFFNLVKMLQDSAQKLPPRQEDGCPYIEFGICSEDEEAADPVELADLGDRLPHGLASPRIA